MTIPTKRDLLQGLDSRECSQARLGSRPFRLQLGERPARAQRLDRPVHRLAQIRAVRSERDSETLACRRLERDTEVGSVLDQPGDDRAQLDDETDATGLQIVDRRQDAMVGIVFYRAMSPCARSRRATRSDVFPNWIPAVRPRRSANDTTFGVTRRFTAIPWLKVR
jgi:hypothetical protein